MPTHLSLRFPLRHIGVVALAVFASTAPVVAQSTADLAALRFYIQQNDQAAINAEIRRLRTAFPNWQPPEDLNTLITSANPGPEIDRIYEQIARGDTGAAQTTLDSARQKFPDWTPPADMVQLLQTAKAQEEFDAVVGSNAARADQIARSNPALTRCNRIDNVWRLAEAQKRAGQSAQARGAYQAIVASCPAYSDVEATLQKADDVSTSDQLDGMFKTAAERFPARSEDLEALHDRLRAGHGESSAKPAATASRTASAPARTTAPRSSATSSSTRSVGGAISAPATPWDRLPATGDRRLASLRAATASGNWARCIALTPDPKSLDLLNERGWCSLNLDRPMEALSSFSAVAKGRVPADVARDARYGMAMSYLNMKMSNEAAKISVATNFTAKQRVDVEHEILVQRGIAAYDAKDYARAIGYLDAADKIQSLNRGLGVLRAYAYLNAGKRNEAYEMFARMHNQLAGNDTRQGMKAARSN